MVALAGAVVPASALELELAAPRATTTSQAPSLAEFFDPRGFSVVAGRAARVLEDLARGARPVVSLSVPRLARNGTAGRIAPFSSRGLAFDGRVKPDLAAPGVALMTSEPGANDDGSARYGTVSGSSAAAATVAGAAAVLAKARPKPD